MRIEKLLKQLKREFIKVNVIQACLDTILFFLISNLGLFFISVRIFENISNLYALMALSTVFGIIDFYRRNQRYRLEIYEEENPELREVLRTARDNLDQRNVASQALFDDVMERARSVTSESIIPSKEIIQKILAVGGLCFLTVLSGVADINLQNDTRNVFTDIRGGGSEGGGNFTLGNSSKIEIRDVNASYPAANFTFDVQGEGESSKPEIRPYSSRENILYESSTEGLDEDLDLAREYSIAIKEFE
ncbi:DUF7502 family protein [Candidatus Nanohalovita haloferacivicina]|uniref:DUF7502 family protein n=1 Tax=Candidatus Nanohalovita haloferacivicina TaxID=2978046 RepID=UPI00325FA3C5|nr:putative membrane protein [Candidatus Nanohalobia archaeon BNXNv]